MENFVRERYNNIERSHSLTMPPPGRTGELYEPFAHKQVCVGEPYLGGGVVSGGQERVRNDNL